ncbi:hypothetical protein PT974_11643 [Cladobotryum mycophilum]|uniref:Uncharacterized protein n=1 Tax=Cladobotryum mycophilum TaxID=491253 RepID=A0ABR0S6N5_9HYPO
MAAEFAAGMKQGLVPIQCDMCSLKSVECEYCRGSLVRMVPPGYPNVPAFAAPMMHHSGPSAERDRPRDRSHGPSRSRSVCSKR